MRYVNVKVRRDTQSAIQSTVSPWEVPILEYIFEQGNIEMGDGADSEREYPDAGAEFARLVKVYGGDSKSGIPHAVSVFGEGSRGVSALRDAIAEAQEDDAKAKRPSPAATRKGARKARTADPLMA